MTDKELLERAAKAAGLEGECHLLTGDCCDPAEPGGFRYEHPDGGHDWWNPLMDDGDALRLAVKLKMDLLQYADEDSDPKHACVNYTTCEDYGDDPYAATRRAIVRAAAQLA